MNNKINGRTHDDIKRGLECCIKHKKPEEDCGGCTYHTRPSKGVFICWNNEIYEDAVVLIRQLERERDEAWNDLDALNYAVTELHGAYEVMKRERDAAVELLHGFCGACANEGKHEICVECSRRLPFEPDDKDDYWQWRGIQESNYEQTLER